MLLILKIHNEKSWINFTIFQGRCTYYLFKTFIIATSHFKAIFFKFTLVNLLDNFLLSKKFRFLFIGGLFLLSSSNSWLLCLKFLLNGRFFLLYLFFGTAMTLIGIRRVLIIITEGIPVDVHQ